MNTEELKQYWTALGINIVLVSERSHDQLLILASGGRSFWEHLPHPLQGTNPLDDYTKNAVLEFGIKELNLDLTNSFLFPNDQLVYPLQQAGRDLNLCAPSPLSIDIHPEFGLWFAFRAVVVLPKATLPEIKPARFVSPCEKCEEHWCMKAAGSFYEKRLSCPVGEEHQYTTEQQKYHETIVARLQS